jgi:hypothetical protein
MALAMRVVCDKEGNSNGGKSNGNKGSNGDKGNGDGVW